MLCLGSFTQSLDLQWLLCLYLFLFNVLIYVGRLNDSGFRQVSEHASKSAAVLDFSADHLKSS